MSEELFRVIDNNTGKEADEAVIALTEKWASGLVYCDMEGFMIGNYGQLILADECGRFAYCPKGRFTIEWTNQLTVDERN